MRRFWRVGIARNAVFFHSFVASPARKVSFQKQAGAEDRLPKTSPKFAPRCGARAIWKSQVTIVKKLRGSDDSSPQNFNPAVARERFRSQNR